MDKKANLIADATLWEMGILSSWLEELSHLLGCRAVTCV